jgi:hypothetical protein
MVKNNPIIEAVLKSIPRWDNNEDADGEDFIGIWTQWIEDHLLGFAYTYSDREEALEYLKQPFLATALQTVVDNNLTNT